MKKKWWFSTFAIGMILLGTVILPTFAAQISETVYFMAVNEVIPELNDETMPRVVNGVVYVPYTMFDPNSTGGDLGLFSSYNRTQGTVMIYSRAQTMIFDLNANNSTAQGMTYSDRAIIRNSIAFVPVDAVCRVFGLRNSRLAVEHGYVIRVKSSSVVLSDAQFLDAAPNILNNRYNSYIQNKFPAETPSGPAEPAPSTSPSSGPTASVPPSVTGNPGNQPTAPITESPGPSSNPVLPEPSSPPEEEDGTALLYAAFQMVDGSGFQTILNMLGQRSLQGIFFCKVEDLPGRDDDIRALIAAGHRIGLLLDAGTLEEQEEQARRGEELLAHIARTNVTLCLNVGSGGSEWLDARYCFWRTSLDATSDGRSVSRHTEALLNTIHGDRQYYALFDDSEHCAQVLSRLLSSEKCEFSSVHEGVLE